MEEVKKEIIKKIYKKRPTNVHKYDYGLLLVIGGSGFYSGSPALAAMAAFRAGVDMVHIIAPQRAADIIASFSPVLATYPLEGDFLKKDHLSVLVSMTKSAQIVSFNKTALVIGGGLGRSKETKKTICDYLSQISIPAVIDADAIHAVSENKNIIYNKPFVLTPHAYEFFLLSGKKIDKLSTAKKAEVVEQEAREMNIIIVLKGKIDIISDGKKTVLNETGTPYLSVGGTGDVLAGICGSIMAQGIKPFVAAQAAAFISGRAGEIASRKKRESLLATDVIDAISQAIH